MLKKILKYILILLGGIATALALFLLVMTLIAYNPPTETTLFEKNDCTELKKDTLTILSWNIGYGGLSANVDHFYEGGTTVRPSKMQVNDNLAAISNHLQVNSHADVIMLQEIDKKSKRSYKIDEVSLIANVLTDHFCVFAIDYDTKFTPIPVTKPMGRVLSGIAAYSKHIPCKTVHHVFPFKDAWPVGIFMLRYGFTASYFKTSNNKELVLINTHNSAFDDGSKRAKEMNLMREFMLTEYKKGNYVIAGGDWNQIPPIPAEKSLFDSGVNKGHKYFVPMQIEDNFMPEGWQWVSDGKASNRFLYEPYIKGETAETLLDFFLVSENVEVIDIKTQALNFGYADHNPIIATFVLN